MKLPRPVVRIANAITNFAIITGIPRPPYTRQNALVIETVGRKSGRGHRIPVGYLADADRILVVVEDGLRSNWVQNALAQNGRLRIHLRGRWRPAKLRTGPATWDASIPFIDSEGCDRIILELVRRHFPRLMSVRLSARWRSKYSPEGWRLITQHVVPQLYEYLRPFYPVRRHRRAGRSGPAQYSAQLRRDITDIVRFELPHLAVKLTVARVTAAIQRYIARQHPTGPQIATGGNGQNSNFDVAREACLTGCRHEHPRFPSKGRLSACVIR